MIYIKEFIYAFLSTLGFSIIFNIPKDSIVKSGITGALGWIIYIFVNNNYYSKVAGAFLGAIVVGMIGEIMARLFKKPATVYIIPGIVPLVPGAGMYYTMLSIIEKNFIEAANFGTETLFIAAAISSGVIISTTLNKTIFNFKKIKNC
ncbi:threonine/serine exporter family protein [Caloranaerobacter azorensis]|uniref:Membrane protein n=2 Tax=Caloranaerobacter azorensis TaxID=116090 RepID=A0A096BL49_9FIRM|nr:threonine/serine exporter family protein [Caloranaerobacter azorensis]KGG81498.1 membrane protein [Caloranaerobacter azorensis H53214]QIB26518.1 threonine/serine exporter [Caloranaerobacter azorensis]